MSLQNEEIEIDMSFFCLDIGGTGTRGALFTKDGELLARASGPGGALSLGAEQAEKSIRMVWYEITQNLNQRAPIAAKTKLFAGIAGCSLPGRAGELSVRLNDFAQTHFVTDGYGALLAATGNQPGALISVGTGVTAMRLDKDGKTLALSGWGFPAGDQGSGAWLGLRLAGLLTKHLDGIIFTPPLPTSLAKEVMAIIGDNPDQIMGWQSTSKPHAYASLAPLIVDFAKRGDQFCQKLLKESAAEIAGLAYALYEGKPGNIHLIGGLGEILLPHCRTLAPDIVWQTNPIDPVQGIFLLASGQAPDENYLPRPNLFTSLSSS